MAEVGAALCGKCAGSVIPQCIPQELKDKLTRPVSYVFFYGSNVADIPTKIEQLKGVKIEVEARWLVAETNGEQIRHKIQEWVSATNEIIDKFESMESNSCFRGSCEVGKVLDEIKKMMNESKHFRWVSYPGGPPQIGSRYCSYNKSLLSREKVLAKISKAMKDSKVNMIGVYGIPGVGKSTLLEELVTRVEADDLFQVIAKVDASQAPDIKMIQASIATRIQLDLPEQGDEATRATLLYQQLETRLSNKNNKILLIFDDICTEVKPFLERIGVPFMSKGEPSCTLLLSSRSSDVFKLEGGNCNFPLDCLDLVEAKILFRDRLGDKISDEQYMSEKYISMENDLLSKCGGLPMAITALVKVLRVRWPDWDDIVSQLRNHNLSEVDGVANTLHQSIKLSYDLLTSDRKKKFFLLCSLFRPGRSIAVEDLMRYGIGLNLFGKIISLEDVTQRANLWVNELKSLSLFESKDDQGCISVHNIIQEFAISIASEGEYLLLLDDGTQWEAKEDRKKYAILSMSAKSFASHNNWSRLNPQQFEHLECVELPKLEALFLKGESSNLKNMHFTLMENLRVLGMTKMNISALPPSIVQLKNLVTLAVEYCEIEDASFLSILVSLKVLSLRGSTIKTFPSQIRQLGDLRLLDLTSCCFGTVLDRVVADLSQLEGLYMCGSVVNQDTDGVITESLVGGLKSFERLNVLEVEIPSTYLASLGDLLLGCTPMRFKIAVGCKFPSPYMDFSSFKRGLLLKELDARMFRKQGLRDLLKGANCLSLVGITNLMDVYDLDEDGLTDLNCLHIGHCNQMEYMVHTLGVPQLEILSLEHLDSLKVICYGQTTQNWFSNLRELKLSYLKVLEPHVMPYNSTSKLAVVEVRDCAGLEYIFSTATSKTNMNGEGYDVPCLRKLYLQRLPRLQALWAGEPTMSDQMYRPLFHEKMNLPSIEELNLSSLDNIEELWELSTSDSTAAKDTFSKLQILVLDKIPRLKHVWSKELCKGSLSFGNLKKVNITDCVLLESLCPPSIPAVLSKLDSLEIVDCDYVKEVIMTETKADTIIEFPSLQRLKLEKLPHLRYFCQGSYTIKFPSLKILFLSSLPKMLTFLEPKNSATLCCSPAAVEAQHAQEGSNILMKRAPFIEEIIFPSLEQLELSTMEDIVMLVDEEHATTAFPELKSLAVDGLSKLKFIPETILNKLEKLKVRNCDSLQGLFEVKSAANMLSLRNLELVDVRSLTQHLPWTLLPKLHSLAIHGGLPGIKSIISSTAVVQGNALNQLEYISIERCEDLEDIVSKECAHEPVLLKNGTRMFPRLKDIKLHNLSNLATFSSGSYDALFPALEKVKVSSCPSLVSFTLGKKLSTPKLKSLQVDQTPILQQMNLNPFPRCPKQDCDESDDELCDEFDEELCDEFDEGLEQNYALFWMNYDECDEELSDESDEELCDEFDEELCDEFDEGLEQSMPSYLIANINESEEESEQDLSSQSDYEQSSPEEHKRLGEIEIDPEREVNYSVVGYGSARHHRNKIRTRPARNHTIRRLKFPKFGAWINPGQSKGCTYVFNLLRGNNRTSADNPSATPDTRHRTPKKQTKSGRGNIGYKAMDGLKQRVCDLVSYKKNIGLLQTKIQVLVEAIAEARSLLISGENDSTDEVQEWLAVADEILKEANGIMDGRKNMADKKHLCSTYLEPTSSWEAGEMLRDIDRILEERKGLSLLSYFCGPSYCKNLKSRENMLQETLEDLMDIHINIIGIYGMIGVGKTVLAEELARCAQNNQLFNAVVMIKVSKSLDIKLIQTQIANKIGLQLTKVDDEETRAQLLCDALEEKIMQSGQENDTKPVHQSKILVILDGIQCVIDLGKVGIAYGQERRSRCKVVLISRNADICKMMGAEKQLLVECLSLDEAKILFQERLGDRIVNMEITPERYQYMREVLLIKCRGLPLVINSLVWALRSTCLSNWDIIVEQVERHTLVEVDALKNVPHAIRELCNNFIQKGEKHKIFFLCCLIQPGMDLTVARLLRYGIGLGLFDDDDSLASILDQINSWVDELKSLSLLLERNEPHNVMNLMMHDIVKDVAISALSQGDYELPVVLDAGTSWHTRESYENCVAISMPPESNYKCVNGLELHKLQACLLKGKPFFHLPDNFFEGMQSLTILDISGMTFVDSSSSIGDLRNLVTLHLEYCDIKCGLISTISTLTKLEVLSLRDCSVESLPEEIGNLISLRVLDLTRCKNLRAFCVDAVVELDRLRGLYLHDICWDWSADDMKKLKSLPLEVLEITMPKS